MVFTSFNFLVFFPVLAIVYFAAPAKYRWLTLLAGSYFFYINMKPVYALLLATVTIIAYVSGRLIGNAHSDSGKKLFLISGIVLILLPLFFFKYFASLNDGISSLMNSWNLHWPLPEIRLLLPVGISFYTFMALGYIIDIYNEEIKQEKNIGILALFISFFPLLLSGPIERAKNMLPQFRRQSNPQYELIVCGLKWMLWGYFMKLVVADRLAIYINAVYDNIEHHNGTTLLFASCLYPFQVYADLGGYSLIAIGTAKILGFSVMQNFRQPFFAVSMADFWRRWHMSLITWLTDYLYTPLSFTFRKYKQWGIVMALLLTFLISGIWHGAAITFVCWGLLQGVFLSIESLTNRKRASVEKKFNLSRKTWYILISCAVTFLLFTASQVFARAENMSDAMLVYSGIFASTGHLFVGAPSILIFGLLGTGMLLLKDFTDEFTPSKFRLFDSQYKPVRVFAYSFVIILILLIGVFDGGEFIYFQF